MKPRKPISFILTICLLIGLVSSSLGSAQAAENDLPGGGWWTGVQIQNIGGDTANIVISSYASQGTDVFTRNDTILQNASKTYTPNDLNIAGGTFSGSATVSSDQPLRAIVNSTNRYVQSLGFGVPGGKAAGQYQGINSPAQRVNCPLVKNNHFGKTTTFYIQNAGGSAAVAQATFTVGPSNQTVSFTTPSIDPNRMYVLNPAAAGVPSGNNVSLGSLVITSEQPLAVVMLEHGNEDPAQALQATRCFTAADQDTKVNAPIIKTNYFDRFTGLQIQNAEESNSVNITVTYQGSGGTCQGQTFTSVINNVPAGRSITLVHLPGHQDPGLPVNPMPSGCLAAATVEATGQVVAVVNEAYLPSFISSGGNNGRQEYTAYGAIPNAQATTRLSVPLYKENSFDKGTGLQVQNVGNSPATNVVAMFVKSDGTTYTTNPQTIPAGGAFTFVDLRNKPQLFNGTPIPASTSGQDGVFGVIVTADQPIVAIANEATYPFGAGNSPLEQDKNNYEAFNLTP